MDASLPVLVVFNPLGRQREHILERRGLAGGVWNRRSNSGTDAGSWLGQAGQCTGGDCTPARRDSE